MVFVEFVKLTKFCPKYFNFTLISCSRSDDCIKDLELDGLYELSKTKNKKLQMSNVEHLIKGRLKEAGFMLSPSQEDTTGDGNCFLYATKDQLR